MNAKNLNYILSKYTDTQLSIVMVRCRRVLASTTDKRKIQEALDTMIEIRQIRDARSNFCTIGDIN